MLPDLIDWQRLAMVYRKPDSQPDARLGRPVLYKIVSNANRTLRHSQSLIVKHRRDALGECNQQKPYREKAMQPHSIRKVIQGNIEAMDQGICLLKNLTDEHYTYIPGDYVSSSIGQHFRHILDLYQAVLQPTRLCGAQMSHTPQLNYDHRRRGASVETCRVTAIDEMSAIKRQLRRRATEPDRLVNVRTEVCLANAGAVALESTLVRELAFASCHATHHYALAAVIARLQGVEPGSAVGLAPTTASHIRSSACAETAAG